MEPCGGLPTRASGPTYDLPVNAATTEYALLDAGAGRRLERFGSLIVDRPAPGVDAAPRAPAARWAAATARYERTGGGSGAWHPPGALPATWHATFDDLTLELRPTSAGQVGVFPEHLSVASWAAERARALATVLGRPAVVLNLFAYTGLTTLALARAGAEVVHVDASRPAVAWARRNAGHSGLAERPVRWVVEDASRFVAREARRGRRYDGVVLDPPTYGHGTRGAAWRLGVDLAPLLGALQSLLTSGPWFLGCTAHATGLAPSDLHAIVRAAVWPGEATAEAGALELRSEGGALLPAGCVVLMHHAGGGAW